MTTSNQTERIHKALDAFAIELPSWGFANTGTRFGKFIQDSAATTTEEKLADAGQVHRFTGCCPSVADARPLGFSRGPEEHAGSDALPPRRRASTGRDQSQRLPGSDLQERIAGQSRSRDPPGGACSTFWIASRLPSSTGSRDVSLWFADGSSYPGTANIRHRKQWFDEGLKEAHRTRAATSACWWNTSRSSRPSMTPTSPIGAWRCYCRASRAASQGAGGYRPSLSGAEHRADRGVAAQRGHAGRLPLQRPPLCRRRSDARLHRSLPGLSHLPRDRAYEWETGKRADIAYMVDQSHNLKDKIEEMIQTAITAQELYAKAALVDHEKLDASPDEGRLVDAEECLKSAFSTDVRPAIREWRKAKGIAEDR